MKIKSIRLKDFKRFKELTISHLPESAKLVVLVGPNGCGKSSLFDAIYVLAKQHDGNAGSHEYYNKKSLELDKFNIKNQIELDFHDFSRNRNGETIETMQKIVYARTAYRNVPSFELQNFGQIPNPLIENKFSRFIVTTQPGWITDFPAMVAWIAWKADRPCRFPVLRTERTLA